MRPAALLLACSASLLACDGATAAPDASPPDAPARDAPPPDVAPPDVAPLDAPDDAAPPDAPPRPLEVLRAAAVDLRAGWRFRTDPMDEGVAARWFAPDHDDRGWRALEAGRTWEEQGAPGYDGVAWYRLAVDVPEAWRGSEVRLVARGVDDEYDVYVNGERLRHHGERPARSVWNTQTETPVAAALRYGARNVVALRVTDWGAGGGVWRAVTLRRRVPLDAWRPLLPEPVLPAAPAWVELYWAAWQMAWDKVAFAAPGSGLADAYMDEGFNEQIYQWDSSFIALFGRYGLRLFPVMATLDNFYARQRPDGYIQRVYSETDGREVERPTADEPMVNPPLFAWVEWEYHRFSGDRARLARVLPALEAYFDWLERNVRRPEGRGLYFQTDLGSGMDNTPRDGAEGAAWVDMSLQQALAARHLARIAGALGRADRQGHWEAKHRALADAVNALLWDDARGFYFDLRRDGTRSPVRHAGAFWALVAGVADAGRAARLVEHLRDPRAFHRPHLFPTLAADDPRYAPRGHYWRGGVWAPTNYAIVRGLHATGFGDLAREAAASHIGNIAAVFARPPADPESVAPEERDGEYRTIWECYAPEAEAPGTRWDGRYLARQDFVGWSGLGPIAMLLESVLGFEVVGADDTVIWTVTRADRHGARRLPLGDGAVSLVAEARAAPDAPVRVAADATRPFTLEVRRPGRAPARRAVPAGRSELVVD